MNDRDIRYSKYQKAYRVSNYWYCQVCKIEMAGSNKYRHQKTLKHLRNIYNFKTNSIPIAEMPKPRSKRSSNMWDCSICNDGIRMKYTSKSKHTRTLKHRENERKLIEIGIAIPNIFRNRKLDIISKLNSTHD